MAKFSKNIVVLGVLVCCAVFLAGHSVGPIAEAQAEQVENIEDSCQDASVLVEAFVVEVKLSALYDLGVSAIGRKPNSVSVGNILKCLGGRDVAQVTTGIKVAVQSGTSGKAKITETTYVERQRTVGGARKAGGPVVAKSYQSYDIGRQFGASAFIRPDGRILVDFEFSQSTYRELSSGQEAPPDTVSREWSGAAYLDAGEPWIVGAVQNEESAVFLVLCANIKGE